MTFTYEKTIVHLSQRLAKELHNKIESIILYGSAARKETHEDSDIDILIITEKEDSFLSCLSAYSTALERLQISFI